MKKFEGITSIIKNADTAKPYGGIDRGITPYWKGTMVDNKRNHIQ